MSEPVASDAKTRPNAGFVDAVRRLAALHGAIGRPLVIILLVGTLAGAAEAAALLAFVRAALTITTDDVDDVQITGLSVDAAPGPLLLVALALALAAAGLHVVLARLAARVSLEFADRSRARLIRAFLSARWSFVAGHREGVLQEASSRLVEQGTRATAHLAMGLSSIVILVALGVTALLTSPLIASALGLIQLVLLLVAAPALRRLRRRADRDVDSSIDLAAETAVTTQLGRDDRVFGVTAERADRLIGLAAQHGARVARTRTNGFTLTFLFKDVAIVALIAVVGGLYVTTGLDDGAVIAAVLLVVRMIGYLQQTIRLVQEGAEDGAHVETLWATIAELESNHDCDGTQPIEHLDTIRFDDVTYRYDDRGNAIDGLDLVIEPGTTVGLIGPSGAGKTTLAELLLGLRRPTRGRILIGDTDLTWVKRSDWAKLTALVPQDQVLTPTSVADNIAFLRPIDRATIADAARRAHVEVDIRALPDGYDHVIGSRSQGLSGGQRQRVAIARALAGAPELLVLDEPTSALDPTTEQLLRTTLDELHGSITIIVIAHRSTTIQACDRVIELRDGRIVSDSAVEPRPSG